MNCAWLRLEFKSFWKPCKNWVFAFFKNSSKNKTLKLLTEVSFSWFSAIVDEKTRFSGFDGFVYDVIPLKPLVQLTKLISVLLSYVITSSLIFINP